MDNIQLGNNPAPALEMPSPALSAPMAPPAPTPTPAPVLAPTPPMPMQSPAMGIGGSGKFDWLRDINWMETIICGLAVGALSYVIAYYRFKLKEDKLIGADTQRQLDNLGLRLGKTESSLIQAGIAV